MGQRLGRLMRWSAVAPVAALLLGSATAWGQGIQLSDVNASAGEQVVVTATLKTGGGSVAGTQNDFTYATAENRKVLVVRKTNNRPDCTVNPDISKGSTTFAFQPPGCTAETCVAVRAIVFSSEDVEPIADGATLYTCKVDVAADAAGTYPLTISGTILSNPTGGRVCGPASGNPPCADDKSGSVVVAGGEPTVTPTVPVGPTETPTQPQEPTATPTAVPTGPGIKIGSAQTTAGQQVTIDAKLATGGGSVAGTQNDFTYATAENRNVLVVRKTNNRPDCTVNPDISKGSTTFAFQPPGCTAETCVAVRAIVFSSEDVEPIADGATLYTCKVDVAASAPDGVYPLTISGTILSNPTGGRVCGPASGNPPCSGDQSGAVTVGNPGPTATPTQGEVPTLTPTVPVVITFTPTPTATTGGPTVPPTGGATATPTSTASTSPTRTVTATATPNPGVAILADDITAADTEIPVTNFSGLPESGTVNIGTEQITYNGIGTTPGDPLIGLLLNAVRGANGTTAAAHAAGSVVTLVGGAPVLASQISSTDRSIPVLNFDDFPQAGVIRIGAEQIRYFNIVSQAGDVDVGILQNAERGANGTRAAPHAAGSVVTLLGASPYDDDGCDTRAGTAGGSTRTAWLVLIPLAALLVWRRRQK